MIIGEIVMNKILILGIMILATAGCSKLHPYCVTIEQGNIIEQSDIAKLHSGLTKNEVAAILEQPLLSDIFAQNVWTYVYTKQVNAGKIVKKKLVLEFAKNRLVKIYQ